MTKERTNGELIEAALRHYAQSLRKLASGHGTVGPLYAEYRTRKREEAVRLDQMADRSTTTAMPGIFVIGVDGYAYTIPTTTTTTTTTTKEN